MMATISPRPISRLTWWSASSAPKRTLTPSTTSKGPAAAVVTTGPSPREHSGHVLDPDVRADHSRAAVLVGHLRLDLGAVAVAVERVDQCRVLPGHVASTDLARPRDLLVVRIELLVQDEEPPDLRGLQLLVLLEAAVHALDLAADEVVDLGLLAEIGVARIGNPPALCPVPDGGEVDVHQRGHERPVLADADGFLHVGRELQLVLEILGRKDRAVGQAGDVASAVDDLQMPAGVEEAGIAGVEPAVGHGLPCGLGVLVVA